MWKALLSLLIIAPAYSQTFTDDIAKINHVLAEQETEKILNNPDLNSIDGAYLDSLMARKYINPITNCEEDPLKAKPLNLRYEVIAVTEEVPEKKDMQPQTTVIVAKFHQEENPMATKVKELIAGQFVGGGSPGRFELKQSKDAGKHVVLFTAPGTNINVDSNVKAEGAYAVDLKNLNTSAVRPMDATLKMDVVNRLSVSQGIVDGTEFKGSIESQHTTGTRSIDSLSGAKFDLSTFKARARLDSQIKRNIHSYSEVNYTKNETESTTRTVAGFDIKAPDGVEIVVFTGFTSRQSLMARDPAGSSRDREFGVEYKPRKGVSIYGRMKDGNNGMGRSYETGIKIDLNR